MLNYLKRRFSSTELINEIKSGVGYSGQQGQSHQSQQSQRQPQEYKYLPEEVRKQTVEEMSMRGAADSDQGKGTRMTFPSAPSSPTKQVPVMSAGLGGVGGGFMNTMAGQLTKAKHLFSTETLNSIISDVKVPGVASDSKCKVLLVIDHPLTDWPKYFHRRKIDNDWDVRVEQAQLNDISISAYPSQGCVVTVPDSRSTSTRIRTFKPDFVLIRQGLGVATQHYENLITGLRFGSVPCMNSVEAVFNMRNKAWLFSNLLEIQKRVGTTEFPLIARSYRAKSQPPQPDFQMPVNVRLGGDSARECEVRVEDATLFQSLLTLANNTQRYATTEPCIQSVCEIFIQKIGPFVKAFKRKPISNASLVSSGSTVLEKIPVTQKFNQWIAEISQLFGGLDMCAIKALLDVNGDYFIQDVHGSDFILLGDGQEEDRARIAELLLQKMEYVHKKALETTGKTFQSQVFQAPVRPVQTASVSPEISAVSPAMSAFGPTRTLSTQQSPYSVQDQQTSQQHPQQPSFMTQRPQAGQQQTNQSPLTSQNQQRPQKPPASNSSGSTIFQSIEEPHSGRLNKPGGSMDFAQSKPLFQPLQEAQLTLESSSQVPKSESSIRGSFDRTTTASTKSASVDFSSRPQPAKMTFGRDSDNFDVSITSGMTTSTTSGASRTMIEQKASNQWDSSAGCVSSRPVREPSLEGTGGVRGRSQKEAAPQPPRQPSLINNLENRGTDILGESSGSSVSLTSTNISDPSMNIFQPQAHNKLSATMSSFQDRQRGNGDGDSIKFDSPSMDFGPSSMKFQHNDPWSVPPAKTPISQVSQTSPTSNPSMSILSAASQPRQTTQQVSSNPDDGDDTMKNLRKTFAGIFGDI